MVTYIFLAAAALAVIFAVLAVVPRNPMTNVLSLVVLFFALGFAAALARVRGFSLRLGRRIPGTRFSSVGLRYELSQTRLSNFSQSYIDYLDRLEESLGTSGVPFERLVEVVVLGGHGPEPTSRRVRLDDRGRQSRFAGHPEIAMLAAMSLAAGVYVAIRRPFCSVKGAGAGVPGVLSSAKVLDEVVPHASQLA